MKLTPAFSLTLDIAPPQMVMRTSQGTRLVIPVTGGSFSGERLSGEVLGGGDWMLVNGQRVGALDVRLSLKADDGGLILMTYSGVAEQDDVTLAAVKNDGETAFGASYMVASARLETGAEQHAWVNDRIFVGEGRILGSGRAEYRFSVVEPSA